MRNLLNFLAKYNNLVIFIILQGVAIYLLSTGNMHHNTVMMKGIRGITGRLEQRVSNAIYYFNLNKVNQRLAYDNAELANRLEKLSVSPGYIVYNVSDTSRKQQYSYTTVRVVNNSINRQKNFITLDRGRLQGMDIDMAVTEGNRVAGVIVGVSDNFSIAMSLINIDFRISARIRSNGYFGSLTWDGRDHRQAVLNEIPQHVIINPGDTVETTSYSAIFPEGLMIGTVAEVEKPGGDFYILKVNLATDFRRLSHVNIISNIRKEEQTQLENTFQ